MAEDRVKSLKEILSDVKPVTDDYVDAAMLESQKSKKSSEGLFDDLIASVTETMNEEEIGHIRRAYEIAYEAHEGQYRRSGEPYIIHPVQVACILYKLGMDSESMIAALLHDVVEDT